MPAELRNKILITKTGYTLFFLVIPILIVNDTYKIFTDSPPVIRITGGLIISIFIIFYFLKNLIRKFLKWLSPGPFRIVVTSLYKSAPLVLIVCIMWASLEALHTFVKCFTWVSASLVVANIIDAFDTDYVQEYQELKLAKRQDKLRGKYNI